MASPEKNFGERFGEGSRNVGIGLLAISLFVRPDIFFKAGLGLAIGGEIFRRVSKPKQ